MYAPLWGSKKRGASVLAAIVLIAVLGAVYVSLQYARSMGSFAYAPTSLTASAVNDIPPTDYGGNTSAQKPQLQGIKANGCTDNTGKPAASGSVDLTKDTCPCNQPSTNTDGTKKEQCLPGCIYVVSTNSGGGTTITTGEQSTLVTSAANAYGVVRVVVPNTIVTPSNPIASQKCLPGGSVTGNSAGGATIDPPGGSGNPAQGSTGAPPAIPKIGSDQAGGVGQYMPTGAAGNSCPTASGAVGVTDNSGNCVASAPNADSLGNPQATGPCILNGISGTYQNGACIQNTGQQCGTGVAPNVDGTCPKPLNPSTDYYSPPTTGPQSDGCVNGYCYVQPATQDQATALQGQGYTCATTEGVITCSKAQSASAPPTGGCVGAQCNGGGAGNTFKQTPDSTAPPAVQPGPVNPAGSGIGSLGQDAMSFLTGLAQGMSRAMAMKQMQQAAQQQQSSYNSPYGTGADGNACPQPQQRPSASTCSVGTWQQQRQSNGCPTAWSCAANSANTPSATLSCQPQTANVGSLITISYSCANATGSSGNGFSTSNQLSGSVTATVTTPSSDATSINYTLTCTNQKQAASAQCAVQVTQPSIVIVANPNAIAVGASSTIGWVTSGMQSCVVSSPDNSAFTSANALNLSINGIVQTPILTAPMTAVLTCQSTTGVTMRARAPISVGGVVSTSTATTN